MSDEYTPKTADVRMAYEVCNGPYDGHYFDAWLAEHDRQTAERAFDEGYGNCWRYHMSQGLEGYEDNPYRQEQAQ